MIILPLISAVVSADDDNKIVFNFLEDTEDILEPKIFYNKDITITGRALENTTININKYWYRLPRKKSIISKEKSQEPDYDLGKWIFSCGFSEIVGASQIFIVPVRINMGKYKIEVTAINNNGEITKEIVVEYNDKEQINKEFRTRIFGDLDLNIE